MVVTAFVDESGNLGTAGRYFVLAALVCPDNRAKIRIKRIVRKACLKYSANDVPLEEIKATTLRFSQKQRILNQLAGRADHEIFLLICDKQHIKDPLKDKKNIIYNYLSGFLIKKIVNKYNDDIQIVFDERSTKVKSMNSLSDYLQTKVQIEWGFNRKFNVEQRDSKNIYCLQAADLVANTTYGRYERGKRHLLDIVGHRIEAVVEFPFDNFGR